MTRLHEIKRAVQEMSVSEPDNPEDGFWMQFRDKQNYFRYVNGEEPLYDVYLSTAAYFDRAGFLQVRAHVGVYNVQVQTSAELEPIFSYCFDGNDQPREQTFLNNIHRYTQKAQDEVDGWAEMVVESANDETKPPVA